MGGDMINEYEEHKYSWWEKNEKLALAIITIASVSGFMIGIKFLSWIFEISR
jgi:hypothetical protein